MPVTRFIGRPSLNFYGKYLSEIARNLKGFGVGRVVVKEKELSDFPNEVSYYLLTRVEPLMSDTNSVRCRAWGKKTFRGKDFGEVLLKETHEPDWRLLSKLDGECLLSKTKSATPETTVNVIREFPPLYKIHLETVCKQKFSDMPESPTMLLRPYEDEYAFITNEELTDDMKKCVWPPFESQTQDGLFRKKEIKDSYFIRISDTPGIQWKVYTEETHEKNM